jgi:hypothetical protein
VENTKKLSKERINEIAYALLLIVLSKQDLKLDPNTLKREMGNLPQKLQHMPEQFRSISAEELQVATRIICHDLVDYALGFDLKKKNKSEK